MDKVHDITTAKKTPSTRKKVGMLSAATILVVGGGLLITDGLEKLFGRRDKNDANQD